MTLPAWPPRDWRAFLALVASIAGSAVLTGFAAWLVYILWRGGWHVGTEGARLETLGKALLLTLSIMGLVLVSLGLAINRRSVKLGASGFEATGGDDEPQAVAVAVASTETKQ